MTAIDLMPEWKVNDLSLTSYPYGVAADSSVDIGEPEMVVETIASGLADGDLEHQTRFGNRTYEIPIYIEGPTLGDLAVAEAELRRELREEVILLSHDPGDGFSPVSVYEVFTARLAPQRNDDHESHLIRAFTLTLSCHPHARSAELTVVEAMEAGGSPSTITVDNCNSKSGWSATRSGAPTGVALRSEGFPGVPNDAVEVFEFDVR